jgi:hypothetical protein
MKKIIVGILVALLVLILVAALAVHFFLDGAIKNGFEKVGPKITKVETKLDSVSLSILSGSGKMKGLIIHNPEGYKSPSAMQVSSSSFAVRPGSLLSDKVVIKSINLEAPELTFETDLKGNNLSKLLANIQETTGSSSKESGQTKEPSAPKEPGSKAESKKLQVDEFIITGTKLHISVNAPLVGEKSATVPIPDIHLPPMGQGPEGVTIGEVSSLALKALLEQAIPAAEKVAMDLVKGGQYLGKDVSTNAVDSVTRGLGGLLQKKK